MPTARTERRIHDLIFVSLEDWDQIWRRNQFLCSGLARRYPERKILFVTPARDVTGSARRGEWAKLTGEETWTVPAHPNITVTRPLKLLPNSVAAGRRINESMFRSHVCQAAQKIGIADPLLWLNPHSAAHMAGRMGERAVIYDITDDWALAASLSPRERRLTEAQDRDLCGRADLVVVCSEALAASRRGISRRLLRLPNGVDAAHYAQVSSVERSDRSPRWPSPVFGYTGSLHEDRLDASLVVETARAFPQGSVVLIGPNFLAGQTTRRLLAEPNVFLPGPVPYGEIPGYMADFDVCIVPHGENAFTESLNPIKLWEYLACGKPVVSTGVAGFRDYAHLISVASGAGPFIAACRAALDIAVSGGGREARMAEAAKHSWDARLDVLETNLEAVRAA